MLATYKTFHYNPLTFMDVCFAAFQASATSEGTVLFPALWERINPDFNTLVFEGIKIDGGTDKITQFCISKAKVIEALE
jgi:hypothetical protein